MFFSSSARRCYSVILLALTLFGCTQTSVRSSPTLRLTGPLAVRAQDVDYLYVGGKTFKATVYQPDGTGPFPILLDVHGGAWVRDEITRSEHAAMDRALAATGIVVVAVDYRQSAVHHYPDSVADVNYAMRWVRANAPTFNGAPYPLGVLGSSSGGHLVLLNALRPLEPKYSALALPEGARDSALADYVIVTYPIADPLARRAYSQERGNSAPVKNTDMYFSLPGSILEGNPQLILERRDNSAFLPPILLLQGGADDAGFVKDTNVSPAIQQRFATTYRAAGGKIQLEVLPGAPHNFVNEPGPDLDRALALIRLFIEAQLAGR